MVLNILALAKCNKPIKKKLIVEYNTGTNKIRYYNTVLYCVNTCTQYIYIYILKLTSSIKSNRYNYTQEIEVDTVEKEKVIILLYITI